MCAYRPPLYIVWQVLLLCMPVWCSACTAQRVTTDLRAALSHSLRFMSNAGAELDWIMDNLPAHEGRRLISVHPDPEWNYVEVRDRRICDNAVICDRYYRNFADPISEQLYMIANNSAVEMYNNIYRQAAHGYRFTAGGFPANTSNAGGTYLITIGKTVALTVDEGGSGPSETIIAEVSRWRVKWQVGEDILDGDLASCYLDGDVFASSATYVVLALRYFDDLCEIAYSSARKRGRVVLLKKRLLAGVMG